MALLKMKYTKLIKYRGDYDIITIMQPIVAKLQIRIGSVTKWSGYIVKNLGPECTVSDKIIYWAPIQDSNLINESTIVTVALRKIGTTKIIGQKSVVIDRNGDNLFSIHK